MRTVPAPTDHVVIVGAGLAGLSAALHLTGAGRRVTVVERNAGPGGRAGQWRSGGYTFDTGPTVLTLPELVGDALAAVGEQLSDRLELIPLDPIYRGRFPDGSVLDVRPGLEAMTEEVRRVCGPRDADGFRRFAGYAEHLYRLELPNFIDRPLDRPTQLLRPALASLAALGGFRRLAPVVGGFVRDPRLRRLLSFQSMYAGLSPHRALALYAVITYMDTVAGVHFPRGGMYAVPQAMAAAAADHGVVFRYGEPVTGLERAGGRVRAVLTDRDRIPADAVVITADPPVAYREWLSGAAPRRLARQRYSPSCVVVLAGARRHYRGLAHHTIFFGRAWRRTFAELAAGQLMSDPSLLVTVGSATDPGLAPEGAGNYYLLAPTPNLDAGLPWETIGPRYRDEIVATLERRGMVDFGDGIEVQRITTPADWAAMGMERGAPFAASHTLLQTGPFRAPALAPGLDNVVFAGSGTQPGVGVPMVLISGRLAADRITGARGGRAGRKGQQGQQRGRR